MLPFYLRIYYPTGELSARCPSDDVNAIEKFLLKHTRPQNTTLLGRTLVTAFAFYKADPNAVHRIPINRHCGIHLTPRHLED